MSISYETLTILAFLIPGFIASGVAGAFVPRQTRQATSWLIEALVASLVVYTLISLIFGGTAVQMTTEDSRGHDALGLHFQAAFLLPLLVASLLLGIGLGVVRSKDLHMKVLRAVRLTRLTGHPSTWYGAFTIQRRPIIVNLTSGQRVFGWPYYYSDSFEEGIIYLTRPAWVIAEGEYRELSDIHGILIDRSRIAFIEFAQGDYTSTTNQGGETDE